MYYFGRQIRKQLDLILVNLWIEQIGNENRVNAMGISEAAVSVEGNNKVSDRSTGG